MNKVFLSGIVAEEPKLKPSDGTFKHADLVISIRHKTVDGSTKKELYPIHCWNGLAEWTMQNIARGQLVTVEGYLTRRTGVEVTAREIVAGEMMKARQSVAEG